jgi:hypothetical protein
MDQQLTWRAAVERAFADQQTGEWIGILIEKTRIIYQHELATIVYVKAGRYAVQQSGNWGA